MSKILHDTFFSNVKKFADEHFTVFGFVVSKQILSLGGLFISEGSQQY